jgi:hypothetical protein
MSTTITKKRNIRYLNRDFDSFKRDLIEHLRIYFPDTVSDFNESNAGILLTELVSFIGDNLSFYLDKSVNESFTESAVEMKNILKHAKQLGFKPFGKSAATGVVDAFIKLPARIVNANIIPDMRYAGTVKRGAKGKSKDGGTFETLTDTDFSKVNIQDSKYVQVSSRNPQTQEPVSFAIKVSGVEVKAGETKTTTFSVTSYESFKKLTIPEEDVLEVLKVTDSNGNEWFEVDYLAQDTLFEGAANTSADASEVPFVLRLRSVPYRFVTEYDIVTNKTSLIFGTGDAQTFDGELIPDLGDLSLPLYGKDTFTDFSLDPQNFLKTRTLGLAPVNTTLTVKYRVGGGSNTSVGSQEIDTVVDHVFEVGDSTLNQSVLRDVSNSFSVLNPSPIQGGRDVLSLEEIKQLIPAIHASQSRVVTLPDFVARSLSMPSKFGSVFRASAQLSAVNKSAVELVVLSRNSSGMITTAPADLKKNLKTYLSRFRMFTDAIEILDGSIINFSVNFNVLSTPDVNKTEIIANCILALKDLFDVNTWSLGQPINITDIYTTIASVPGVISLIDLNIENRVGTFDGRSYSSISFNTEQNKKNGIIYIPKNSIVEIKYPNKDLAGAAR